MWFFLQYCFASIAAAQGAAGAQGAALPRLEVDTPLAREGYFVLGWESDTTSALRLQSADNAQFNAAAEVPVLPAGNLTLTGLPDGEYWYRVGSDAGWSNVQHVRIEHHPLSTALLWFSVGAVLFAVLVFVILSGSSRIGREEQEARQKPATEGGP